LMVAEAAKGGWAGVAAAASGVEGSVATAEAEAAEAPRVVERGVGARREAVTENLAKTEVVAGVEEAAGEMAGTN
jgi:hypothetical protein